MTNRTFEDLQRRCNTINRKRWIKRLILLLLFFILLSIFYFVYLKYEKEIFTKNKTEVKTETKVKIKPKKEVKKVLKKDIIPQKSRDKNSSSQVLAKTPKTDLNLVQKYDTVFLSPTIVIPDIKKQAKPKKYIDRTVPKEVVAESNISMAKKQIPKKKKFVIKVKSLEDEESLIKANRAKESFESTMKLSNFYFKKSKYEKTIYWSKKANHYKPSSFKPWFLYAEAKIKQGKKDEAIKAIETFLSYFNSDEGERFLQAIKEKK